MYRFYLSAGKAKEGGRRKESLDHEAAKRPKNGKGEGPYP